MDERIERAKETLKKQKEHNQHDQDTLETDHVKFSHAYKMFWRQGKILKRPTTRHNYWYMFIWQWAIKVIIFLLSVLFGTYGVISSLSGQSSSGELGMVLMGLMVVSYIVLGGYVLLTFVPMMTLTMRRYYDIGLNRYLGALIYILLGILVIIWFISGNTSGRTIALALFGIIFLGNLIICSLPKNQFLKKND